MEKFRAIHSRIDTKNSDHSTTYCWQKVLSLIVPAMVDRQDLILLDSASINLWELDVEFLLLFTLGIFGVNLSYHQIEAACYAARLDNMRARLTKDGRQRIKYRDNKRSF